MNARLQPVCEASLRGLGEFWGRTNLHPKDADNCVDCPMCGKRVKLRKRALERFPNTIPWHHVKRTEGAYHLKPK